MFSKKATDKKVHDGKLWGFLVFINNGDHISGVCSHVNTHGDVIEFYLDGVVVCCISKAVFCSYELRVCDGQ